MDANKVATGEQADIRDPNRHMPSKTPPLSSTDHLTKGDGGGSGKRREDDWSDVKRNCYIRYYEYNKCIQKNQRNGGAYGGSHCEKFAKKIKSDCQDEWIAEWDEDRARGSFPLPLY